MGEIEQMKEIGQWLFSISLTFLNFLIFPSFLTFKFSLRCPLKRSRDAEVDRSHSREPILGLNG